MGVLIPLKFLDETKYWKVALHSFGLHLMQKQNLCPKSSSHPAVIHISYKNLFSQSKKHKAQDISKLPLNMFEEENMLYIDDRKSYSAKSLVESFESQVTNIIEKNPNTWCGIPVKFNENGNFILIGQFDMDGNDYEDTISSYDHILMAKYITTFITTLYLGKKIFIPLNPRKMNFLSQRLKSCRSFHQILNML